MSGSRTVAITGATGLLGAHFSAHLRRRGWRVRALVRDPERCTLEGVDLRRFSLPDGIDRDSLVGVDLLIHCAATTRAREQSQAQGADEAGSRRLFELARAEGVERTVFLSSVSAHPDARSQYARSKLAIESFLDPDRDLALRLGLVLSRGGGGLFERMVDWVRRMRVIPIFGGGHQPVQPIHVEDVCGALDLVLARDVTGTLVLADPAPIPFRALLEEIARRLDRKCRLVPIPFAPALTAARLAEFAHLPLPIGSENLLGLQNQRFVPSSADLDRLGLQLRPLAQSLDEVLVDAGN